MVTIIHTFFYYKILKVAYLIHSKFTVGRKVSKEVLKPSKVGSQRQPWQILKVAVSCLLGGSNGLACTLY